MNKILFVPTNSREIAQFDIVRQELKDYRCEINTIAIDRTIEDNLHKKKFLYKSINDYKTANVLNIIKKEKPDIIITDFCGPIPNALINAANYVKIPVLQIDDGITNDYSAFKSIPSWHSYLIIIRGFIRACMLKREIRPFGMLFTTLFHINSPVQFLKKSLRELKNNTYLVPSYAEGLNIAVMSPFAKEAYIKMGVPAKKFSLRVSRDLIQYLKKSSININ